MKLIKEARMASFFIETIANPDSFTFAVDKY